MAQYFGEEEKSRSQIGGEQQEVPPSSGGDYGDRSGDQKGFGGEERGYGHPASGGDYGDRSGDQKEFRGEERGYGPPSSGGDYGDRSGDQKEFGGEERGYGPIGGQEQEKLPSSERDNLYQSGEERSHGRVGEQEEHLPASCERDYVDRSGDQKSELQSGGIVDPPSGDRDYGDRSGDRQAEGDNRYSGEPESAAYGKEEIPRERKIDQEPDSGPDRIEGEPERPASVGGGGSEAAGYDESTGRVPAEKRNISGGYEQSPYVHQVGSQDEFNKKAYGGTGPPQREGEGDGEKREEEPYGGAGFQQREGEGGSEKREEAPYPQQQNPEQQHQAESAERGFAFPKHDEKQKPEVPEGDQPKPDMKEKVKETLIPCRKTETLEDKQEQQQQPPADGVPKSPGLIGKVKEKLTGGHKSHEPAPASDPASADYEAADAPPKKNVFEKVKEKLSPSPK